MNAQSVLTTLAMVGASGLLATQIPINAALARTLRDPLLAACVLFGVGFLVLAIAVLVRNNWSDLRPVAPSPLWIWFGGVFGAAMSPQLPGAVRH
jgi:transporter family-2 protein